MIARMFDVELAEEPRFMSTRRQGLQKARVQQRVRIWGGQTSILHSPYMDCAVFSASFGASFGLGESGVAESLRKPSQHCT